MARQRQPARPARRKSLRPARRQPATRVKPPAKRQRPKPRHVAAVPDILAEKRASYQEAVRLYEAGLAALQRREFGAAGQALRQVIEQFPDERELHDRARLYLRVCDRQSEPSPPPPRTLDERIYAATVALNAGDPAPALRHLQSAVAEAPDHDHVQYMLAVAHALRGETEPALDYLRRAIELNPDNRMLARQEADFESLRNLEAFKRATEAPASPSGAARRRPRSRTKG